MKMYTKCLIGVSVKMWEGAENVYKGVEKESKGTYSFFALMSIVKSARQTQLKLTEYRRCVQVV